MQRRQLGHTGIDVSALCLGTMTWGTQTDAEEAHDQIDMALEAGIDFIDTAEMYPVNPSRSETVGRTERIIGLWLEDRNRRSDVVLATKHAGEGLAIVREGAPISAATIPEAIEGSLRRMKTDYIDLYQFHWPNRGSYMFRKNWNYDPSDQDRAETIENMEECLDALQNEVDRGTIRAFGLSNESAWGTMQWLDAAERTGGPRPVTIQNEYSLMCRMFDTDLAELCVNEDIGLLGFSPLAAGLLTGKYQNAAIPEESRMSINPDLGGRKSSRAFAAVDTYLKLALKHEMDPVHMALAWCQMRPFMLSVVIGARDCEQLERAIAAADMSLPAGLAEEIDTAHRLRPMPF